jgi:hypothetical protein
MSTDATGVETALVVDPLAGIEVPRVTAIGDRPDRRLDELPPALVLERLFDRA